MSCHALRSALAGLTLMPAGHAAAAATQMLTQFKGVTAGD
jgi:hypothetical protein